MSIGEGVCIFLDDSVNQLGASRLPREDRLTFWPRAALALRRFGPEAYWPIMHRRMDFDWTRARAFLATADHGTLSAAGQALGIAQPTVGRQVAALEADLGIVLFERSGNRLSLTPAGLELLEHVREMEAAANRVLLAASGRARALEGEVTITASGGD